MTLQQLQIFFYGVEAVVLLIGFYALYEWGYYLYGRVKAGNLPLGKAQNRFAIPAAVLSLLPALVVVMAIKFQPYGGVVLFDLKDATSVFTTFKALFLGFVLQGISVALFWFFTRKLK